MVVRCPNGLDFPSSISVVDGVDWVGGKSIMGVESGMDSGNGVGSKAIMGVEALMDSGNGMCSKSIM